MSAPESAIDATVLVELRGLLDDLQRAMSDYGSDFAARFERYADLVDEVIESVQDGTLGVRDGIAALENVLLAVRSDLIAAGYQAQSQTVAAYHSGVSALLRVLALLS